MRRRFRYDPDLAELVEIVGDDDPAHFVMVRGDIAEYSSIIDGSRIVGRRQHADHLRRHSCQPFETGSEKDFSNPKPDARARHEAIWEAADRVVNRRK